MSGAEAVRRAARPAEEHRVLTRLVPLRWPIPKALSQVRTSPDGWAGMLVSHLPGRHRLDAAWPRVAEEITGLLGAVESRTLLEATGELPPVRAWCGGPEFPALVAGRLAPLLPGPAERGAARDAVRAMLDAEASARAGVVHGDLGLHNVFWDGAGRITALIDLDHAAVADPAVDVAPFIGHFGARAVGTAVGPETLRRAMLHRATLSLQVAAGAELAGDPRLRDHALANFTERLAAGTLHDPEGDGVSGRGVRR